MMEIIDNKYVLVNSDYFICTEKRKFKKIKAVKCRIPGFEKFEFFYYKVGDNVIISEATTGAKISKVEGCFVDVFKDLKERLNDIGAIRFKEKLRLKIKVTNLSPRYRYICTPTKRE